jgi:hypothetical protein
MDIIDCSGLWVITFNFPNWSCAVASVTPDIVTTVIDSLADLVVNITSDIVTTVIDSSSDLVVNITSDEIKAKVDPC